MSRLYIYLNFNISVLFWFMDSSGCIKDWICNLLTSRIAHIKICNFYPNDYSKSELKKIWNNNTYL